jgi:hypothetical protein
LATADQLLPVRRHVRNGKVARLPAGIRESTNVMLNNGHPYSAIARKLKTMGYPGISVQNLCRWRRGGYEDWLAAQDKFDLEKLRAENLTQAVKAFHDSSSLEEGNRTLLALHIFRSLQELQGCPSEKLLESGGSKLFRLIRLASAQSAEQTKRERLEFNKEVHETDLVDQLLSNPNKLNSILDKIRERLTGSPTPSNHTRL